MKAVTTLNRLHRQVQDHPRRICELFEKEAREELGVVPGQSWTLKDYVKRQQWGKFKGIFRCAIMDVAAYEYIRSGQHESAAAQLIQNLKAKMQSVLQGGDWSSAWLLTGLQDPLARREFAGSREEMAIVSGYVDALHKLQKRVREAKARQQRTRGGRGRPWRPRGGGLEEVIPEGQVHGRPSPLLDGPSNSSSSFLSYVEWFERNCVQGYLPELSGPRISLFPSVLPYPETIRSGCDDAGVCSVRTWWSKRFVNALVCWGNFVTMGCPKVGDNYEPQGGYRCLQEIREVAGCLAR